MMFRNAVGWLLPLALLAGCTSTDVAEREPTGSASSPASSATTSTAGCAVSAVTVAKPTKPQQTFVYAVRLEREEGRSRSTQLVAAPFTPTVIWQSSPAPKDAEALAAIGDLEDAPPVEQPDSTAAVNQFLHDADIERGDVVGYSSVVAVQQGVRVSCAEGGVARGTLTTWTDPELGMVSCADVPKTDADTPARLAYEQFCGSGA